MVLFKDAIGYQINSSGVPTGTINVNGSLDYNPGTPQSGGVINPGNWITIIGQTVGSGTSYPVLFDIRQTSVPYVQLQFVSSTSAGVLAAYVVAKSIG